MPGFDPRTYALSGQSTSSGSTSQIEDTPLYLPSSLSVRDRRRYCSATLISTEEQIREAQANDSLEDLRHNLRTRSFTNRFKVTHVTGQVGNTRAREYQARIDDQVRAAQQEYCRARQALKSLWGAGEWEVKFKVLEKGDVRALNERELTAQEKDEVRKVRRRGGVVVDEDALEDERVASTGVVVGDGQRRPSWIWYHGDQAENIRDPRTQVGEYWFSSTRDNLFNRLVTSTPSRVGQS